MKVLVTGSNGMVARAAFRYCCAVGDAVIAASHAELDITDREAVLETMRTIEPDAVLNCAAYTDVDAAESNVERCFATNAVGPENLAMACRDNGARFVTISTDYVFAGEKEGFYTEDDEPSPQSVYARSKLEGEMRVATVNPDAVIVRSGWIYGDGGTNFLSMMPAILRTGQRIKAISDSYGTPTFADDLGRRLRELAAAEVSGVIHVANAGAGTSYLEFANAVAEIGGITSYLIESVSMDDLSRPAARPRNSRLASVRKHSLNELPDWRDSLARFLNKNGG